MKSHIVKVTVPRNTLKGIDDPPLCDSCGKPFVPDNNGNYTVYGLVLAQGRATSVWGVLCEECVDKFHSKLPILEEKDVRKEARDIINELQTGPVWYYI